MKAKRDMKRIMQVFIVAISLLFMSTISRAATTSMELGTVALRESGYSYEINERKIWKLIRYSSDRESHTWDQSIYCLSAEKGFTSKEVGPSSALYNKSLNMKTDEIPEGYWKIGDNRNAVLWILDNSFIEKQGTIEEKTALLKQAQIARDTLSAEEIEVVQQAAIWYFTNPEDPNYHTEELGKIWINTIAGMDGSYQKLEEKPLEENLGWGKEKQEDASKLYRYFITKAKENSERYDEEKGEFADPITIQKTEPQVQIEEDGTTIVGPYTITKNTDVPIRLTYDFQDQMGREITDYRILLENDQFLEGETLEDAVRQTKAGDSFSFWIKIESGNNKVMKVIWNTKVNYTTSDITFWTNGVSFAKQQPVAIIGKQEKQIEEKIETFVEKVDFSLKSYISEVNGEKIIGRDPVVSYDESTGKLIYSGVKEPLAVKNGDLITFTFRIYNEGTVDGYGSSIITNLPEGFSFILDNDTNLEYNWAVSEDLSMLSTNYLAKPDAFLEDSNLLKAYDKDTMESPDYREVKLVLKVIEKNASNRILINYAEIESITDKEGILIQDIDSIGNNQNLEEDDIDFEKVKIQEFDLALQTFVSKVNNTEITNRIPIATVNPETMEISYQKQKQEEIKVQKGDTITYTIRIYNEGDIEGYAKSIMQTIPEGLQFVSDNEINKAYRWEVKEEGTLVTNYLAKEQEEVTGINKLKVFDGTIQKLPDYRDVKLVLEVTEDQKEKTTLKTIAEIKEDSDYLGNDVIDRDSTPNNQKELEDDRDEEEVTVEYGDLHLEQFIVQIGNIAVNNREVRNFYHADTEEWIYEKNESIPTAKKGDTILYTIRIYNEGTIKAYATSIVDYIPEGLEFLENHEINQKYGWEITSDQEVTSNYLAKENGGKIIQEAKEEEREAFDYQEIQIALKVTKDSLEEKPISNKVEIRKANLENGDVLKDIDSTIDNKEEAEDDFSIESIMLEKKKLAITKKIKTIQIIGDGKEESYPIMQEEGKDQRIELESNLLKGKQANITYQLEIKNVGNVASLLPTIIDEIPENMSLVDENNNWEVKEDGKIVNKLQENELLLPGESKIVEVTLKTEQAKQITRLATAKTKLVAFTREGEQITDQENAIFLFIKTGSSKWIIITCLGILIILLGCIGIKKFVWMDKKEKKE